MTANKNSLCTEYNAINIYYKNRLAEIGGIETATYNIAYKYADKKDILFLINDGDIKQIKRLMKYGRVEIMDPGKTYRCKKCFITYETFVPKNIIADKYARVSHGDLFVITDNGWEPPKEEKVTEDYGVSRNTCESVKWYFGKDCKYCPNPFIDEPVKPLLKLISPQRMTWEKGKDRIIKIAEELEKHDIPFQWHIVCNNEKEVIKMNNSNLIWVKSRLDIKPFIKDSDYLVLVSECEGSPMAPQESLMLGVPVIVTDLPCYKDLKLNENNSFILKKDLSNLNVEEIYNKKDKFNFKWEPPKDIWGDILEDGKLEKVEVTSVAIVKVVATKECLEYLGGGISIAEAGGVPQEGKEFEVTEQRANDLINSKFGFPLIKIVGKVEIEKQKKLKFLKKRQERR